MRNKKDSFDSFSSAFVRAYLETVKSNRFPMPPNEPVEETLEELISAFSHETEVEQSATDTRPLYKLRMTAKGEPWLFISFREGPRGWVLAGCSAPSCDDRKPLDLLDPIYFCYFDPFLRHVTDVANAQGGMRRRGWRKEKRQKRPGM